jgi:hypothetical protein
MVSDLLLKVSNFSAIYHGKDKLNLNEMMMMSALY